ncbi:MAG: tRNA (adenosine(37)-N6)-threonylcarbamoyltransferase complex dimerization subunit type 1 TsaB [Bacteroidales bacterium]|nr:tRNA (adenosine(37)-N6)-threonylcarbamoyltransferase complex dimerization subunit type 1 TsaB [Bacteroidales bacterium]
MANFLLIETATEICSVSLVVEDKVVLLKENTEGRTHAADLAVFIDTILKETGFSLEKLDAVVVSKGPGSYTGLRIGVSAAKGLCYGSSVKLISIPTLHAIAAGLSQMKEIEPDALICPMIDARRMEVYTAIYDSKLEEVKPISAEILDESFLKEYLDKKKVYFVGDGAFKLKEVLQHPNIEIVDDFHLSSTHMLQLAQQKLTDQSFEDVAYFEPFYLKDFIATVSKKNVLGTF